MKLTMDPSAVVSAHSRALRQLAALPGFDHRAILKAEAGVILKTWAGRTKVATNEKTDQRSRLRFAKNEGFTQSNGLGSVTINVGVRGPYGRVWRQVTKAGKSPKRFLLIGQLSNDTSVRWRDRWGTYSSALEPVLNWIDNIRYWIARGRKSQGIARQSVIQIADALGIKLEHVAGGGTLSPAGIAKARAAIASNGRAYRNGTGFTSGDGIRYYIDLLNSLPYNARIGMDRTLTGIIHGRTKFIETSYAKGAFDSIKGVARNFPQLLRVSGMNLNN